MDIINQISNYISLQKSLDDELVELMSIMNDEEEKLANPIYKRFLIRSTFSLFDAYAYIFREIVKIKIHCDTEPEYTIDWTEMCILNEKTAILKENGTTGTRNEFQSFKPIFKFTIKITERVFNVKMFDFSNNNWGIMQELYERRNDISHPKLASNFEITNDEVEKLTKVNDWFFNSISSYNNALIEWFENDLKRYIKDVDKL